jgi:hypothetical protein
MRRTFEPRDVVAGEVVDRGLVLLERADVVLEAPPAVARRRRLEAGEGEGEEGIAAFEVLVDAFLEDGAEMLPDLGVVVRLLLRERGPALRRRNRLALEPGRWTR